ncbi:unnamed protein product, partial [Prorocentrum cordatum]
AHIALPAQALHLAGAALFRAAARVAGRSSTASLLGSGAPARRARHEALRVWLRRLAERAAQGIITAEAAVESSIALMAELYLATGARMSPEALQDARETHHEIERTSTAPGVAGRPFADASAMWFDSEPR